MPTQADQSAASIGPPQATWQRALARAVRDPDELIDRLNLADVDREAARRAARLFPVMVPPGYLARIKRGNPRDPLLLQVLPLGAETIDVPGFLADPLEEDGARIAPGLLRKYRGRALLIVTGACAVHCRYCFRRDYPYAELPRGLGEWEPALEQVAADTSLREIILSGGDPLMLTDARLRVLIERLAEIRHLRRLRLHTRLPIVLPERITEELIAQLTACRLTPILVVHANHPQELTGDCGLQLRRLVRSGITVLNQAVLLRHVNDSADTLCELCERLVDLGVIPYYLHQLDRVKGTAHFEVDQQQGRRLIEQLRARLPGYAVPKYVREIPGEPFKIPLA